MYYVEESVMLIQGIMLLIRFTATTAHLISYTPLPSHSPLSLTLPSPPPPASCFLLCFLLFAFCQRSMAVLYQPPMYPDLQALTTDSSWAPTWSSPPIGKFNLKNKFFVFYN